MKRDNVVAFNPRPTVKLWYVTHFVTDGCAFVLRTSPAIECAVI